MKIIITGGGGFIGSNLVPALLSQGYELIVVTKTTVHPFESHQNLIIIYGEFDDDTILDKYLPGTHCVIHLAYSTVPENSMKDPVFDIRSNVIPTFHLLKKMHEYEVPKLLFVSSGGVVYGKASGVIGEDSVLNPVSSYGISKMIIERNISLLADNSPLEYCILRVANAYGSGQHNKKNQGVINIWMNNIMKGLPVIVMGDGNIIRDYVHVDDLVEAFSLVIDKNIKGVFNIGTAEGTSLNQLISVMESLLGKEAKVEHVPDRKYDVPSNVLSYQKFHLATGWKPKIDLKKGLERMIGK